MPNTVANTLRAARRSMEEMILPAIDAANPLAREQAQLVVQTLRFVEEQLPFLHAKDRAEMCAYAEIAAEVLAAEAPPSATEMMATLRVAHAEAQQLARRLNPADHKLQQASVALADALSRVSRSLGSFPQPAQSQIRIAIVSGSKAILDIHRAFFLPTGFDRDAAELPSLERLLHGDDAGDAYSLISKKRSHA